MVKIKNLPTPDRPREKLEKRGAESLSDFELLEALIGSGNKSVSVEEIARDILTKFKNNFDGLSLSELKSIKGVSFATACQIKAAIEISKRYLIKSSVKISKAADVLPFVQEYRNRKQEHFICISLDGASNVIQKRVITVGTLSGSLIHPREVFADAITDRAAGVIFVHNHPADLVEPSDQDKIITKRLVEAGKLLGVTVLDHVIVTQKSFYSFKEKGLI